MDLESAINVYTLLKFSDSDDKSLVKNFENLLIYIIFITSNNFYINLLFKTLTRNVSNNKFNCFIDEFLQKLHNDTRKFKHLLLLGNFRVFEKSC